MNRAAVEENSFGLPSRTEASVPRLAVVDGTWGGIEGGVNHRRQDLPEREGVDALLVERRAALLGNLLRASDRVPLKCTADLLQRRSFDESPRFVHALGIALA